MTKPMIRVHNLETNEVIDREMNDAEFAQWEADKAAAEAASQAATDALIQRQVLLAKLGITEEEAKLLLS